MQLAPRTILQNQVDKATQLGYKVNVASELEYYLYDGDAKTHYDNNYQNMKLGMMYPEDYNLLVNDRGEPLIQQIRKEYLY